MGLQSLWKNIAKSKTFLPARFSIPAGNIDPQVLHPDPFSRHQQYFEVKVNEMYLSDSREWFTTWDPVVIASTGFLYKGQMREVPFIVGPQMIEENSESLPDGMVFESTKVAGMHPYRGGSFSISMVLARMQKNHYLKRLISIMENTSKTYFGEFATAVVPYTKVAGIMLDSLEELLGTSDLEPLIGHRFSMNPDTNEGVKPGYFVLINESENAVDESRFYVIDDRLYYGDSLESAAPYRNDDYVLYSILAANYRSDVERLPYFEEFEKLRQSIREMGATLEDEKEKLMYGKLFALTDTVRMSPDLIRSQVEEQIAEFRQEIKKMIDDRQPLSGGTTDEDMRDEWEQKMDRELSSILKK